MRLNVKKLMLIAVLVFLISSCSKTYTVVFDTGDSFHIAGGDLVQKISESNSANLPILERDGYVFVGWSQSTLNVVQNMNVSAIWRNYTQEEIYEKSVSSVVEILTYDKNNREIALGSGFFFNINGEIITNYHVIEGAVSLKITLSDGSKHDINQVVAYDEKLDLAILKTNYKNTTFLKISEREIKTGESVFALGSSKGFTNTFTSGNISQVNRIIQGINVYQMTAPISSGNSGGPLIDIFGKVIGVNAMKYTDGDNIYFSIKLSELKKLDTSNPMSVLEFARKTDPVFLMESHFIDKGVRKTSSNSGTYYEIIYRRNSDTFYFQYFLSSGEIKIRLYDVSFSYLVIIDLEEFSFFEAFIFDDDFSVIGYDDDALFLKSNSSSIVFFDLYYSFSSLKSSFQDLLELKSSIMILGFDLYMLTSIGVNILNK
jgi:hypothetical protein